MAGWKILSWPLAMEVWFAGKIIPSNCGRIFQQAMFDCRRGHHLRMGPSNMTLMQGPNTPTLSKFGHRSHLGAVHLVVPMRWHWRVTIHVRFHCCILLHTVAMSLLLFTCGQWVIFRRRTLDLPEGICDNP